ncbi:hypothetical protein YSA_11021 [Pseudomonas putida ND6]|uniref:Uncharacterized protein n=1 Tax=Pseudomonas putida ND6 TaxID=231023 RepID=I3V4S4_PSEPU|nr:hypothetical protein YSA_11021 [Pseudomonas putida ND6]
MVMAVVPDDGKAMPILHTQQGQVAYSTPELGEKGSVSQYLTSVSGH